MTNNTEAWNPRPEEIDDIWPGIAPLVARGLERGSHGEYTVEDVHAGLVQGRLQLWMAKDGDTPAIGLTQVATYPRFRTVLLLFCVGDGVDDWQEIGLAAIEKAARANGMRAIEVIGREGWSRRLGLLGYRRDAVTLRKELDK